MPETPHFAFPFALGPDNKVGVVEQDSADHVMSCENVIVRCPTGFRQDRPEFGWDFPEFHPVPLDLDPLTDALRRFEPRGKATGHEYADSASAAIRHIGIDVEINVEVDDA
jgi:phage baseplate assembly protein W